MAAILKDLKQRKKVLLGDTNQDSGFALFGALCRNMQGLISLGEDEGGAIFESHTCHDIPAPINH
jgi:hypothetical protein